MIRLSGFLFSFIALVCVVHGQDARKIDSLQRAYTSAMSDTTRILVLTEIAGSFSRSKPDTTLLLANQAAHQSEEINYDKGKARSYNMIGLAHWMKGNYMEALMFFQKSLPFFSTANDQLGLGLVLNNIGLVQYNQSDYVAAGTYFEKALKVHEDLNNQEGVALALSNIGLNYEAKGDLAKALEYYQRALAIYSQAKMKTGIARNFTNIGYVYLAQKDYPTALKNFEKAQKLQEEVNDQSTLISSLLGLSQLYQELGQYEKSIEVASQALKKSMRAKIAIDERESSQALYRAYSATKNYEKALQYYQLYKQFNDSIFSVEKTKAFSKLYAGIELAEKQKELDTAQFEKARQQKVTILVVLGMLVMVTLFLIILFNRKKLQTAYHKLEVTNHDLSEVKRKIEEQADMLIKSNHAKDKIFSIVSHDLRSPLNGLKGLIGLMDNKHLTAEEFAGMVPDLSKRLNHASDVTEELLHWSRNQMEASEMKPVVVSVTDLFHKKAERFSHSAIDKGITIKVEMQDDPLHVMVDVDMLKTVVRNLLSNAIKFCRQGDSITMGAVKEGELIKIFIRDTGVGISPEHLSKIFMSHGFTTSGTSEEKGIGLGLMLCKEFVEKNGGQIGVESTLGKGTTFYFTLPSA